MASARHKKTNLLQPRFTKPTFSIHIKRWGTKKRGMGKWRKRKCRERIWKGETERGEIERAEGGEERQSGGEENQSGEKEEISCEQGVLF